MMSNCYFRVIMILDFFFLGIHDGYIFLHTLTFTDARELFFFVEDQLKITKHLKSMFWVD